MSRGHVNLAQAVPSPQPVPKPGTPSVQLEIAACTSNSAFTLIWEPPHTGGIFLLPQEVSSGDLQEAAPKLSVNYGFPSFSCSHGGPSVSCTLSTGARTAQGDPKASACPKATLNPEERIASMGSIQKQ